VARSRRRSGSSNSSSANLGLEAKLWAAAFKESATCLVPRFSTVVVARDTLLPKLILGELRVKDAGRVVAGAV
jgi:hypothetical protein